MVKLLSRLTLVEALGLSLAVVAPTVTAAINVALVVQSAGPAAPLAFAIGALATALVALSFMAFTHRVAHAGSAYAYVTHTFGARAGFVAGWTLLLAYIGLGTGFAAVVGNFLVAALKGAGVDLPGAWLPFGAGALLLAWWFAYQDMRLASRVMLAFEGLAIAAILVLCAAILRATKPGAADLAAAFTPSVDFNGWLGLGAGMVFAVLAFTGFEGSATLGEETLDPRRNIPIALFGTVLVCTLFFIFVAWCEIVGFGPSGLKALGASEAPLDELASRYVSARLAVALDLAAATTCFSGAIGALAAGGRVLYALGRAGLWDRLATVHPVHRTPAPAIALAAALNLAPFLCWAPFVGAGNYYSYTSTIAVLALIVIYVGVGTAEVVEARRERRRAWAVACAFGPLLMAGVLVRNLYPVPEFPNNLWPYVTVAWIAGAGLMMRLRPRVTRAPLPDYR